MRNSAAYVPIYFKYRQRANSGGRYACCVFLVLRIFFFTDAPFKGSKQYAPSQSDSK